MAFPKVSFSRPYWIAGFISLLVLLPLPFGGNRPWASDLFGALAGVLLLAQAWETRHAKEAPSAAPLRRMIAAGLCVALVALWSFLQTTSLTPTSWHHPLWQDVASMLGLLPGGVSVDPSAMPEALVRFLSFVACFLLAFMAGRDRDQAKRIVRALGLAAVAYALYGLVAQSAGGTTILWYKKWAYQGFLTSTFVNKNSYACYAGLGFLCSLAAVRQKLKHIVVKDVALAKRSYAAAWFAALSLRDAAVLCSPVVVLGALALTGSRGGVFSALLGALALFISMAIYRRASLKRWLILSGLLGGLFLFFVGLGGASLLNRMQDDALGADTTLRLNAYTLIKEAIGSNPWYGFGLGSFDGAFRLYRDETLPLWFQHAHNDYLEMAMDLGIPMALVLLAAILLMVSCCVQGIFCRRRDAIYPSLGFAASVLVGTHALMDFSLHIPAIAATYAALLGLGVAQSLSSKRLDDALAPATQSPAKVKAARSAQAASTRASVEPRKKIVRPSQPIPAAAPATVVPDLSPVLEEELPVQEEISVEVEPALLAEETAFVEEVLAEEVLPPISPEEEALLPEEPVEPESAAPSAAPEPEDSVAQEEGESAPEEEPVVEASLIEEPAAEEQVEPELIAEEPLPLEEEPAAPALAAPAPAAPVHAPEVEESEPEADEESDAEDLDLDLDLDDETEELLMDVVSDDGASDDEAVEEESEEESEPEIAAAREPVSPKEEESAPPVAPVVQEELPLALPPVVPEEKEPKVEKAKAEAMASLVPQAPSPRSRRRSPRKKK